MGKYRLPALILLVLPALSLATERTPLEIIQQATDEVLAELDHAPEIRNDPVRLNRVIEKHVLPHVDFTTLSRLTLGKHWRTATPEQRAQFAVEFRALLVRTYSASLTEYSNQHVEYIAQNTSPDSKRVTVRTRIVDTGRPSLPIDYSLRKVKGHWKIYDVTIEGISLAVNYRATFAQEIRSRGLEGLIRHLSARNASGCPMQQKAMKTPETIRC